MVTLLTRHLPFTFSDARKHVNKMCLAADRPLVESGTAGFIGQVQPIKKVRYLCHLQPTIQNSPLKSGCF